MFNLLLVLLIIWLLFKLGIGLFKILTFLLGIIVIFYIASFILLPILIIFIIGLGITTLSKDFL
ncbi:hypothetical protein CYJ89_00275 [Lactobacillus jensenii]|jgi:hypothetical protein|uniref:Uncharacterized protein n=1 Tax=Lactobacillus jensenii TaxID=109790 RepID=A0A5N1IH72_LACJE|nr:hypothetical protein BUE77_03090 [Lactobacillus jensenii]EEQ25002.1 hypothetical protein LACJE0001_0873 [Lactobacillus jensenii 269-3]EEQ68735.1 hypothetical protein LBJG_01163 [Lactobacillus jensenii 1153]ERJ44924.1 hypothetical protein N581_01820 [Lactobacillus jensenii MD IIE-70(2)]KAA9236836.1 hypothetical protein F6I36_01245 [Lactobacillus jensenii]